jgi:hypothetical protein
MDKISQSYGSSDSKLMWIRAAELDLHCNVQIEDEDATTKKKLIDKVPEHLKPSTKKSDHNHIKRNLKDRLQTKKKEVFWQRNSVNCNNLKTYF